MRLFLTTIMCLVALAACSVEQVMEPYDQERFGFYPEDAVLVGDNMQLTQGQLSGEMTGIAFGSSFARMRVNDNDPNYTSVQLALPVDDVAVMHQLGFEGGLLSPALEPGSTFTFQYGRASAYPLNVDTVACRGPEMDRWDVDVTVQRLDLEVQEGPTANSKLFKWEFETNYGDLPEVSTGSFVLGERMPE